MLGQLQRARRRVIGRIRDYKATLGDANNQVYADPGFYWVRPLAQSDANGNSTPGIPYQVRSGSALVVPRGGRQVWVGIGLDGHLTCKGFVHEDLVSTDVGIDPRSLQPNDPYRAWIRLKQIQNFRALPLATGNTTSLKVQVRQLFYYTETGDLVRYNGTNDTTHIDLSSYVPAAGLQRYVVLWLRVYNPNGLDDIQVTASSTISSLDAVLSFDELQECANASDADTIPIQAFRLHDAGTTLVMDDTIDIDLRQFINMPQVYGFPNVVNRHYRIHEDHSVIMPEVVTISAVGGIQIQSGGVLVILDTDGDGGTGAPGGTVTSVAVSEDTDFLEWSGSPITTSGTLALNRTDGLTANRVLATPDNATGKAAMRALVDRDVPNVLTLTSIKDSNGDTILLLDPIGGTVTTWLKIQNGNGSVLISTDGGAAEDINIVAAGGAINLKSPSYVTDYFAVNTVGAASHPCPSMTTTERNALSVSPQVGDLINNTTTGTIQRYNGSGWDDVLTSATGARTALNNLASVAINTTLVSDTNDTDDLGTSGIKWREVFAGKLNITSTTKGSIPAPSMTASQRDAISSPSEGSQVYVNDQNDVSFYDGSDWQNLYRPYYSETLHPFTEHTIVTGSALTWSSDTSENNGGFFLQGTGAVNDEITWQVALPAGTYHIEMMTLKNSVSGIVSLNYNGSLVSSHDLYSASLTYNVRIVSSNFNVNVGGVYTFGTKVASKNGSSTGYRCYHVRYQFIRTANYP
jgi:hypothetical protein